MSIMDAAWSALGEDAAALALVRDRCADIPLESALPVGALVHDAMAVASLSAALLAAQRAETAVPTVELNPARVATGVTSERHFLQGGQPMNAWAELSGFWPTADGWVRTHGNYPHHRARLLAALRLPDDTHAEGLAAALTSWRAQEVDDAVTAAGGIATIVRTEREWRDHPQSAAVAATPLIGLSRLSDAPTRDLGGADVASPAAGVRVLDLTRVIAGPVCSRTLGLWGADVLRVDPPALRELEWQHLDTGAGKRSVVLDVGSDEFRQLLADADVVITGYRPGALDRLGLSPEVLVAEHPGIIVARLSAWGTTGPFAERRGFDSIVQAASGIALLEGTADKPGALPAQALDHAAGYLLAAGITTSLRRRSEQGGSWLAETSLARVAGELLAAPRGAGAQHPPFTPTVETHGDLVIAAPAAAFEGGPTRWASGPVPWASSDPTWLPTK